MRVKISYLRFPWQDCLCCAERLGGGGLPTSALEPPESSDQCTCAVAVIVVCGAEDPATDLLCLASALCSACCPLCAWCTDEECVSEECRACCCGTERDSGWWCACAWR